MKKFAYYLTVLSFFLFLGCSEDDPLPVSPFLNITFIMDETADRLDNFGDPISVPDGNAGQNPDFEVLGLHFIGLYPDKFTPFDQGSTVFQSPTTEAGGIAAIDFDRELFITPENNTFSIPLDELEVGTYEFFRSSIGYQQFKIDYNLGGASQDPNWPDGISDDVSVEATIASFLGYNTYIGSYSIENEMINVNENKLQGYFGMYSRGEVAGFPFSDLTEGDAPVTTVPNPIDDTSPVPEGSCVVTGQFPTALVIPENPTQDINIQVVISINKSFEWVDTNGNGKYEPLLGEQVVDMGTRGVFPSVK
ncbi:hypothetical protein [Algoriphagus sediminis]|uniref:Lipoprotein n=1 Tax=Algoriphagus sediminis TaxID=3057113 RepID=A0ABT7YFU6_9BACT|nr:hypothetical protein [Algoriphagus sediminis]MDN3205346.1 hypothetical protein [Algoriphagus sediminis]